MDFEEEVKGFGGMSKGVGGLIHDGLPRRFLSFSRGVMDGTMAIVLLSFGSYGMGMLILSFRFGMDEDMGRSKVMAY